MRGGRKFAVNGLLHHFPQSVNAGSHLESKLGVETGFHRTVRRSLHSASNTIASSKMRK
jgi:hypothetical protein